ncbi:MAG TPA: MerR family transcriptional regulator [Gammaproteobacteria bacterium]|jgi:DNA-binding transcriptional MerR regulator
MNVHDLAKRAGVPSHVVRYYTQRGLLHPQRNAGNGYREFAASDLYRLQFICRAKRVGFTLTDIQMILGDADRGASPCQQVRRLVRRRATENEERLADAQRLQQRIREAVETWETVPDQPPDHESLCRLIDAIALDEGR